MRSLLGLLVLLVVVLVGVLAVDAPASRAESEPLVMIIGARSKVTTLSLPELGRVFRGALTRNEDGDRFVPLNHPPGSPLRAVVDRVVLGMTPDQAQSFWIDQKIRAAAREPRVVNTVSLAVKLVATFPGAISYVPRSAVTVDVKVLRIEGKLPSDAGYPLR